MPEEFKWVIESDRETPSTSSISDWENLRLAHCSKEDYRGNGNKLTKVKLLDIKPEIDSDKKVYNFLDVKSTCKDCGKPVKFSNYIGSDYKVNFEKGIQKCGCGSEEFFAERYEHYHGNFDSCHLVSDFQLRCVKCGKENVIIEAF